MELLIVGLDGLSYNMLERFDVGAPYLSSERSDGVSGHLMSVDTPTTLPAWTSFATGKGPGSHGVTNMLAQGRDYHVSSSRPNFTDAAAYDFLEDSLFVNLPASVGRVPAAEGTLLVSSMLARDEDEAVPDELKDLDAFEEYVLDHDASLRVRPSRYVEHVLEIVAARHRFAREAFETHDPRVGFVLFSATDWAGHILGNLSTDARRREVYGKIVDRVDECAADLGALADNVVLMSDHGFEHKHTNVHVNEWLHGEGYFAERESETTATDVAVSVAKAVASRSDRLYGLIRRVHNHVLGTSLGSSLNTAASPDIDYPISLAWELRYGCLYLNDDRFASPTVDDPDALCDELVEGLEGLTTEDGEPLFRDVGRAEEVYADPGTMTPDVVARPAEHCFPTQLWSPTGGPASPTDNYEHRYRGIFAAAGPAFATGTIEGLSIVDVLPTAMAALGEPLSPEFDGEARIDALSTDDPPRELEPEAVPAPVRARDDRDAEREEVVERRLADLGYLE